jgi:hypothetical protein
MHLHDCNVAENCIHGVAGCVLLTGVQAEGNCDLSTLSDPHKEFVGKNVLMQVSQCLTGASCCIMPSVQGQPPHHNRHGQAQPLLHL